MPTLSPGAAPTMRKHVRAKFPGRFKGGIVYAKIAEMQDVLDGRMSADDAERTWKARAAERQARTGVMPGRKHRQPEAPPEIPDPTKPKRKYTRRAVEPTGPTQLAKRNGEKQDGRHVPRLDRASIIAAYTNEVATVDEALHYCPRCADDLDKIKMITGGASPRKCPSCKLNLETLRIALSPDLLTLSPDRVSHVWQTIRNIIEKGR